MTEDMTYGALVPLPHDGAETALSEALVERVQDYAAEALSPRTREAYGRWQRRFTAWCDRHGRQAMPASPETIAGWLAALADGVDLEPEHLAGRDLRATGRGGGVGRGTRPAICHGAA